MEISVREGGSSSTRGERDSLAARIDNADGTAGLAFRTRRSRTSFSQDSKAFAAYRTDITIGLSAIAAGGGRGQITPVYRRWTVRETINGVQRWVDWRFLPRVNCADVARRVCSQLSRSLITGTVSPFVLRRRMGEESVHEIQEYPSNFARAVLDIVAL